MQQIQFKLLVPNSDEHDIYASMMEWKLSFLNCQKVWEEFAKSHGSYKFTGLEGGRPRFMFPIGYQPSPEWSTANPLHWRTPVSNRIWQAVNNLPRPESFTSVCIDQIGLPDIPRVGMDAPYKLLWTKRNRMAIRALDFDWLQTTTGLIYDYPSDKFRTISNERMQYWFAKDRLLHCGEELD